MSISALYEGGNMNEYAVSIELLVEADSTDEAALAGEEMIDSLDRGRFVWSVKDLSNGTTTDVDADKAARRMGV